MVDVSESKPLPDVPASRSLTVELVTQRDSTFRRAVRTVFFSLLEDPFWDFFPSSGRVKVVVRDRWSGETVYVQDYKHDAAAAAEGKGMIESDLERLDREGFLAAYGIQPPTPGQGG